MTNSLSDRRIDRQRQQDFISPNEASYLASTLQTFRIDDFGSSKWLEQHQSLEALTLQAQTDAHACRQDEAVNQALVEADKISSLVVDLIISEAWLDRAFPALQQHIADHLDPILSFALVQHESTVAALLEVVLHHSEVAQALSDDAALELCDWCARKMVYLDVEARKYPKSSSEKSPRDILTQTVADELSERAAELRLASSLSALAILRHITDHADHLPLSAIHRAASTNAGAASVVPLLVRIPWERPSTARTARRGAEMERWENGGWINLSSSAAMGVMGSAEVQAWLLLSNFLLHPVASTKLELNEPLIELLLQLRPKLTAARMGQLPGVLIGIQRFLDELAVGVARPGGRFSSADATAKVVIDHAGPMLRTVLLNQTDWEALAETQRRGQFAQAVAKVCTQERINRFLEGVEYLCEAGILENKQKADNSITDVLLKVDAYREEQGGQFAWHGTYRYRLRTDVTPETFCIAKEDPNLNSKTDECIIQRALNPSSVAINREPVMLTGKRYRLCGMVREAGCKALPPKGKLVVSVSERASSEAFLMLPVCETRDSSSLPSALWVTVGSLSTAGLALQLKVKKAERAVERAGAVGEWCVYSPTSGALSLSDEIIREIMGEEFTEAQHAL